jgi:hypothetical protein
MRPIAFSPTTTSRGTTPVARPPEEAGSAFVPFAGTLEDILCVQEERLVGNDNTVRYKNRVLQIPADRHRHHYVKVTVRVHEYPDGTLAVFHGPRRLARYSAAGTLLDCGNSRSRPIRRSVPSTAATWPCGSDRSIRQPSVGARNGSPRSTRLSASTLASGQCVRLASVRLLTLPPSRQFSRKSTAGGDERFGTRVTYINPTDHVTTRL